ncbi:MAG: hydroxyacid dehydrogenase [Lachnospiraceae bacterium]|jgi:phosphoglycerate dehydrogenase-like enzyme|nr:hydroxyacid dehydrogenase [Lachnospiraceae bacterium]
MYISLLEPLGVPATVIEELSDGLRQNGHYFTYYDTRTSDVEELKRRSAGQDIIMIANTPYPDEVVRAADSLKLLAVAFTGIDHVGQAACREKGVTVCNCAGYSNASVAELVIGMTVSLFRQIRSCDQTVRSGGASAGLMGMEIGGKTVGIIGCGQIGFMTARMFQAMGANVIACARHEREEVKAAGIRYVDLDTLLARSDIVSLHTPSNQETRGMIDGEKIGKMKPSAVFINCARGPIVDNAALAAALNEGRIAGAAVDVFDVEPPLPEDTPLLRAKNTLLTPHVAFLTKEAMARRARIEFDNVYAYLEGRPVNACRV